MIENVEKFFARYKEDENLRCRIQEAEALYPGSLEIREAVAEYVLLPVAEELGTGDMIASLRDEAMRSGNDSRWLRSQFHRLRDLPLVVESMSQAWRGEVAQAAPAEPTAVLRRRIRATSEPMQPLSTAEPRVTAPLPERLH